MPHCGVAAALLLFTCHMTVAAPPTPLPFPPECLGSSTGITQFPLSPGFTCWRVNCGHGERVVLGSLEVGNSAYGTAVDVYSMEERFVHVFGTAGQNDSVDTRGLSFTTPAVITANVSRSLGSDAFLAVLGVTCVNATAVPGTPSPSGFPFPLCLGLRIDAEGGAVSYPKQTIQTIDTTYSCWRIDCEGDVRLHWLAFNLSADVTVELRGLQPGVDGVQSHRVWSGRGDTIPGDAVFPAPLLVVYIDIKPEGKRVQKGFLRGGFDMMFECIPETDSPTETPSDTVSPSTTAMSTQKVGVVIGICTAVVLVGAAFGGFFLWYQRASTPYPEAEADMPGGTEMDVQSQASL